MEKMTEKEWKRLLFCVRADIVETEVTLSVEGLKLAVREDERIMDLLYELLGIRNETEWQDYVVAALKEGEELDDMMANILKFPSVFTGTLFCKNCDHEGDEPDFITDEHETVCPQCLSIKIGRRREL
jgi:hypothetical protein